MMVVALIVVPASTGTSGSVVDQPATWADVNGRPLLAHAIGRVREAGVDRIVVSVVPADVDLTRSLLLGVDIVARVSGAGLPSALAGVTGASAVLLHDAHRALAPPAMIQRVLHALRTGAVAVVPVLPVVDTIRSVDADGRASAVVDRDALRIVQTPQGFDLEVLRRVHAGAPAGSDTAALMAAAGFPLTTVTGHADADRVLTTADLDHARRVLAATSPDVDLQESTHG